MISGKPVCDDTCFTGTPAFSNALSQPLLSKARALVSCGQSLPGHDAESSTTLAPLRITRARTVCGSAPFTVGGFLRAGFAGAVWGAVAGTVFAGLVYAAARWGRDYRFARAHAVAFGVLSGGGLSALLMAAVVATGGSLRGLAPAATVMPPLLGALIGVAYGLVAGGMSTQKEDYAESVLADADSDRAPLREGAPDECPLPHQRTSVRV